MIIEWVKTKEKSKESAVLLHFENTEERRGFRGQPGTVRGQVLLANYMIIIIAIT